MTAEEAEKASNIKEVWLDENLVHGARVKVGLIADGFRAQGSKDGKPMKVCIYDERFDDYVVKLLQQHIENDYDNRLLFTGPSGTGKSTKAIGLAQKLFPKISQEDVCFRLKDFVRRLDEMKPAQPENGYYPAAVLDESGVDLWSHDWQKKSVIDFQKVFQIIRKKRLTIVCCLPHRLWLVRGARDSMHWWFDMMSMHEYRGFSVMREVRPNPWGSPWWRPMAAYTFDKLDNPFWHRYEERKVAFIKEFMSEEEPVKQTARSKKLMEQRDACIRELRKKNVSLRDIEKLTGLDDAGVSRISNKPAP